MNLGDNSVAHYDEDVAMQTSTQTRRDSFATSRPVLTALPDFDLSKVVSRVAKENPDWSQDRLRDAEDSYRAYLAACKLSAKKLSPAPDADEVWHAHILHTREYARDCGSYFGYFLHHVPTETEIGAGDADCQGDSSACTSCGSGCSGGGTITMKCSVSCNDEDGPLI